MIPRPAARSAAFAGLALAASAAAAGASQLHAQQPQVRPLGVEEALGIAALAYRTPIDLSPDGKWVAYTVQDTVRRVRVTHLRTGEDRHPGGTDRPGRGPVWSPDGNRLAFFSERDGALRLTIWDRATGELREVEGVVPRSPIGFAVVRWSADGEQLLLKTRPGAPEPAVPDAAPTPADSGEDAAAGVTAVVFDAVDPAPADTQTDTDVDRAAAAIAVPELADITLVDVASEAVRRLARNVRAVGYWLSPDARHAAYTVVSGVRRNTQDVLYDLVLVGLPDGRSRTLARDLPMEYGITVSWSPDGGSLAVATADSQLGTPGELFVVPADIDGTAELRKISHGDHPSIAESYRAPLWDVRGESVYVTSSDALWRASLRTGRIERVATVGGRDVVGVLAPANNVGRFWSPDDGGALFLVTVDTATWRSGYWRVDLRAGTADAMLEEDKYYGRNVLYRVDVSDDGGTIVYAAESPTTGEDLWVTDGSFRSPRRATRLNPQLDGIAFGPSRLISWSTAEGTTLRGALLLPAGYRPGTRYPLIVRPYAGSMLSRNVFRFGGNGAGVDNLHILTTRGYAVLLPDVPQRVGSPMADIAEAVLPALDRVVELGIADPDRLGVTGHSYGGYSTLALITRSTRFAAAVSSAGPANLVSHYGTLRPGGVAGAVGWAETGQGKLGGHPWEHRDRYIENSPIFWLDRVRTPLLLVHGGDDASVRTAQAEEVFVGLRRLRKPVAYVRYDDEGHWQGTWRRVNVVDYWTRVLDWFGRYLKRSEPTSRR